MTFPAASKESNKETWTKDAEKWWGERNLGDNSIKYTVFVNEMMEDAIKIGHT